MKCQWRNCNSISKSLKSYAGQANFKKKTDVLFIKKTGNHPAQPHTQARACTLSHSAMLPTLNKPIKAPRCLKIDHIKVTGWFTDCTRLFGAAYSHWPSIFYLEPPAQDLHPEASVTSCRHFSHTQINLFTLLWTLTLSIKTVWVSSTHSTQRGFFLSVIGRSITSQRH